MDEYLLPDSLTVGDILENGDRVTVVLETQLRRPQEADMEQVLSRWHSFQNYTFQTIKTTLQNKATTFESKKKAMMLLFDLLSSTNTRFVNGASTILRDIVCSGDHSLLQPCNESEYPGNICLRTLLQVASCHKDPCVQRNCAAMISFLLEDQSVGRTLIALGAGHVLVKLSRSDCKDTRVFAADGLGTIPVNARTRPVENPVSQKSVGRMTADEAVDALISSSVPQVHCVALETILETLGSTDQVTDLREMIKALNRICSRHNSEPYRFHILDILVECSGMEDKAIAVTEYGGFQLLVDVIEEQLVEDSHEGKEGNEDTESRMISGLIDVLNHENISSTMLIDAVAKCTYRPIREQLTQALVQSAKKDDGNEMFSSIGMLLSCASQTIPGTSEQILFAQTISVLSVKQANKSQLIKYGAPKLFASYIQAPEVALQRIAAKTLANLSSSANPRNRQQVLEAIHEIIPSLESVSDSIVSMYLEMVYN